MDDVVVVPAVALLLLLLLLLLLEEEEEDKDSLACFAFPLSFITFPKSTCGALTLAKIKSNAGPFKVSSRFILLIFASLTNLVYLEREREKMMRGDERDEREREGKGGVGRAEKREEKREEQIPN